jgi:hypothetical protein
VDSLLKYFLMQFRYVIKVVKCILACLRDMGAHIEIAVEPCTKVSNGIFTGGILALPTNAYICTPLFVWGI